MSQKQTVEISYSITVDLDEVKEYLGIANVKRLTDADAREMAIEWFMQSLEDLEESDLTVVSK